MITNISTTIFHVHFGLLFYPTNGVVVIYTDSVWVRMYTCIPNVRANKNQSEWAFKIIKRNKLLTNRLCSAVNA